MLAARMGVRLIHVPYRGTAPAVNDAVAGQIQLLFTGAPAVLPMVRAGKLKALAVSSAKRLDSAPELPTVAESDPKMFKGFEADQWYGVVAPAGTPADIVAKLNATINASLSSPEMSARLRSEGAIAMPSTPEAFGKQIATELARWKPVVSRAGIKPE
jgi:tripartite-type tricarboxylate transporter receptor subunit TctC